MKFLNVFALAFLLSATIQVEWCVGQSTANSDLQTLLSSKPLEELAKLAIQKGDAFRGAIEYYRPELNCVRCHESAADGRRLGPDLAKRRNVQVSHLVQSVLFPSEKIDDKFKTVVVRTIDGDLRTGVLVNETDSSLIMDRIEEADHPLEIAKTEIDEWRIAEKSVMPEQLVNQLTSQQQFLDLVKYLIEIEAHGRERADALKPDSKYWALPPLPDYESQIDHARLIENLDDESFENGKEIYRLRCASCHGTQDSEGSMPTSLRFGKAKFKNGGDPHAMYQTITHGYGMMNAQRWMVPIQKYEVIHYIREEFLNRNDGEFYFEVNHEYLADLPEGNELGPEPVVSHPWSVMDYGPSLNNTIEASGDGSNIAQKGVIVRLDDGPGGVAAGRYWMMYDHDTMRISAAWSGEFIDYNGIHFNGVHNQHPKVDGKVHLSNPNLPGWARPKTDSFNDERLLGRDGKPYGPLPHNWIKFDGMYRFGAKVVLEYSVGGAKVYESPDISFVDSEPVFIRRLDIDKRENDLIVQVARSKAFTDSMDAGQAMLLADQSSGAPFKVIGTNLNPQFFNWEFSDDGDVRLRIKAGQPRLKFDLAMAVDVPEMTTGHITVSSLIGAERPVDLQRMTVGGTSNWPQTVTTEVNTTQKGGPFEVDTIVRPVENPWNDRMRLTGIDFFENGSDAVVCCWDGSVYHVSGVDEKSTKEYSSVTWRRIAAGLFQPLGVRIVDEQIFVMCRDQLVRLHDLNDDGEMDWYENFNSDHQVTEHFHEFAMGLQTDDDGNFYYAKSACHALKAVVPHHGTLLKISNDGATTEIVANGFRAANGVCLNPDGTFMVTDQEGHWHPKNRINRVKPNGFYGNMFGYHDVTDESDEAMDQPLCWITNSFDRSPGELLWVTSEKWKPLLGSLLNFSYGTGQIFIVPYENANGQWQGGMSPFPIERLPTGIMRGRFNDLDGQLYCCGMFAWAGDQQQPGGLYRIRYTGKTVHLPNGLESSVGVLKIAFSDDLDQNSALNVENYQVESWDIKRSRNYGSRHYNKKSLQIENVSMPASNCVVLHIPELSATRCMEIRYKIRSPTGAPIDGIIHNTIHELKNEKKIK